MKKWIIVTLMVSVMAIYGCSDTTEELPTNSPEQQQETENDEQETTENTESTIAEAQVSEQLSDVLYSLVEAYGFMPDESLFYENKYEYGLLYTQLIDFDGDGVKELYLLLKSLSYFDDPLEHRNADEYIQEVWKASEDGDAKLVFTRNVPIDDCMACDYGISIVEIPTGEAVLEETIAQTSQGGTANYTSINYLNSNEFKATQFHASSGEEAYFEIDSKEVSEAEYTELSSSYKGYKYDIILSNAGTKAFYFKAKSSAENVSETLRLLTDGINSVAQNGIAVEPDEIQAEAEALVGTSDVDVNNPAKYTRMFSKVMFDMLFSDDLETQELQAGFEESYIAGLFEQTYGIPLNMDYINLPKGSGNTSENFEPFYYENGRFYAHPTEYNKPDIIRTVKEAFKMTDNLYYVSFTDTEVNLFSLYSFDTNELTTEEYQSYKYEPVETWPVDLRRIAVSAIQRYAIIMLIDGTPVFRYLGYRNLTDEQIENY